jgi:hypothetical protein
MQRGKAAINQYCEQMKFASFVIEGGLDYLIPRWEKTVRSIKSGYTLTVDEYLNDMDTRRIIDEVWPLASDEQVEQYRNRLQVVDQEYFTFTIPVQSCIWGSKNAAKYGYSPDHHWWYYHIPTNTGSRWKAERLTVIH